MGFATSVFNSWVNNRFLFAPVRRDVLIWWSGAIADRVMAGGTMFPESSELLASLTPNKQQITQLVLLVYHGVVKPNLASHDAAMAQVEGYVHLPPRSCGDVSQTCACQLS